MKDWNDQKIQDWLDQQGKISETSPVDQSQDHQVYRLLYESLETEQAEGLSDGFENSVMVTYQQILRAEQKLLRWVMTGTFCVIGLLLGYLVFLLLDLKPVVQVLFQTLYSYKWHFLFASGALALFQFAEQKLLKRKADPFGVAL
jgi:hypothetical protein